MSKGAVDDMSWPGVLTSLYRVAVRKISKLVANPPFAPQLPNIYPFIEILPQMHAI